VGEGEAKVDQRSVRARQIPDQKNKNGGKKKEGKSAVKRKKKVAQPGRTKGLLQHRGGRWEIMEGVGKVILPSGVKGGGTRGPSPENGTTKKNHNKAVSR